MNAPLDILVVIRGDRKAACEEWLSANGNDLECPGQGAGTLYRHAVSDHPGHKADLLAQERPIPVPQPLA